MSSIKTFSTQAIVLKRTNVGESDRIVTLFSEDYGKIVTIAKGVRKMTSAKKAYLEPGNLITAFCVNTKSLPLLTQARLLNDFAESKHDLRHIRQLTQVLEIVDKLFVESQEETVLFQIVCKILTNLGKSSTQTKQQLEYIINQLGYEEPDKKHLSLLEYVSEITDKPMRSWEYLKVRS